MLHVDICIIKLKYTEMNTLEKTIVRKIEWFSNDTEMILSCEVVNGVLRYNTKIAVAGSCLNQVLSDMQKQSKDYDVNDCLIIEQWSEDEVSFLFDFSNWNETEFIFQKPNKSWNFRQIRA